LALEQVFRTDQRTRHPQVEEPKPVTADAAALRTHALALADTLGYVLVEDPAPGVRVHCDTGRRRRIVTEPIADLLTYYKCLHELGHAATVTTLDTAPGARLLAEARAYVWSVEVALVEPDQRTELDLLEAWACHIEARGGNVAAGGVELVAAEHQAEYRRAWARCRRNWTWEP
jgi:hypothetical protein